MAVSFLVHEEGDTVGVAVTDVPAGRVIQGRVLSTGREVQVATRDPVPLGHKVALRPVKEGETVREYGRSIGVAVRDIPVGAHVHVHNLRSARW